MRDSSIRGRFSDHPSRKKSYLERLEMETFSKLNPKLRNCSTIGVVFLIFIIFVGDFGHFVVGQTLESGNNNSTTNSTPCVCGVDRVPCAKSLTSSDCPNGRVISRRDCPCCFLCAKQLTDECNNEELLCDSDYGLECGSDKRCKAKTQCSDDTACSNDLMCFGGACADACKVLPDVCKESNMTNGICVARNHRAICVCPPGKTLNSGKECVTMVEDEGKKCETDGRHFSPGESTYTNKCKKSCKCETSGQFSCEDVSTPPTCNAGFIPMSNLTGEMTDVCKILVANDALFDGCCVPEKCQIIKAQDPEMKPATNSTTTDASNKGGRDFKLTESHNNLGEDDTSKLKIESNKDLIGDGSSSSTTNNEATMKTESKADEELMKVTVSKRSSHSAVINLPKNEKEAILSISLSKELAQSPGNGEVWKEHKIPPGLSQITLSTLLPNTSYTLKYVVDGKGPYPSVQFITEAEAQKGSSSAESMSSEGSGESSSVEMEDVVVPTTLPTSGNGPIPDLETTSHPVSSVGCLYNGTSYEIGEIFHMGCDERCECMSSGEVKCMERCSIPLFKKGSFAHDKFCFEEPSGIDDCCVLIACARAHPNGRTEESGREIVAIIPQPCDSVKCGPNAHCLGPAGLLSDEEQQTNQTLCVCNEGHLGDPYDEVHGCQSGVTPTSATEVASSSTSTAVPTPPSTSTFKADGCVFKNKTYTYGQEHFDDCSYKCRCETSGEFLCVPRCNYRRDDEEKEIPAGCKIEKDPSDLECCEMLVCHGEPLKSGTRKDSPTVPTTDGCIYKNVSHNKDEKFYDGCSQQCMCFSNGDVTCQPRCPPAATNSSGGDGCVTLPDPSDPKCCTVTVCDNSTLSDVMKDSTTTTTTTIAPAIGEGRSSSSLSETDPTSSPTTNPPPTPSPEYSIKISLIHPLNDTTIMVAVRISDAELNTLSDEAATIQYSTDVKTWKNVTSKVKDAIKTARAEITLPVTNLMPNTEYHFKALIGKAESNVVAGFTKSLESLGSLEDGDFLNSDEFTSAGESEESDSTTEDESNVAPAEKVSCSHKEKKYDYGKEFFDGCESYCTCRRGGKMKCVHIDCPMDGLDLVDDTCLKWEPDPKFKKEAPNCCPQMKCVQHSSCIVEGGLVIRNFDEIPQKLTGCDKRCYCEFGNVTCQNLCPTMTDHPPANLPCPKEFATVTAMPENECCYEWSCRPPQIPHHHLRNLTDLAGSLVGDSMLNKTAPPTPDEHDYNNTRQPRPPQFPLHRPPPHGHDRFRPPPQPQSQPGDNPPTLVHVDKINPHQLQELLHHLTTLGEGGGPGRPPPSDQIHGGGEIQPPPNTGGTYVQVQTPQQVRELERELGAKFVDRGEDGSYIVMIPSDDQSYPDQGGPPGHPGQGQGGPPFSHAIPPPGFPGQGGHQFPFGLNPFGQGPPHGQPGVHHDRAKVANIVIHPLNESTLQIDFTVSPILVGLQGHVEVLYTSEFQHKPNPAQWERKVFQQAEDLIDNTHLQLFLTNLKPDTEYHVQIKVVVVQSDIGSTSDIMRARTPPLAIPTTTLPPEIIVDPEIQMTSASSNSLKLTWKKFTEPLEKSLVDGVQIAYKANDDKVYSTTPLIHRSLNEYVLENLQPDKEYEIKFLFVPFDSNQKTVLKSEKPIFVRTTPSEDEYSFNIAVSTGKITESTAELVIQGVPHPEDKFVNIYQVIYMSDQKEQKDYFKVPKRDTSKKATLTDLKPATNYTLWLEAFLSNGKKKRSNVISIQTKAGQLPRPEMSGQENQPQNLQTLGHVPQQASSYYGALVALAIVAALSIIGVIALLMILVKKQNSAKAPINDRKSESSYDNPSFKSYDVESNGHMKASEL